MSALVRAAHAAHARLHHGSPLGNEYVELTYNSTYAMLKCDYLTPVPPT